MLSILNGKWQILHLSKTGFIADCKNVLLEIRSHTSCYLNLGVNILVFHVYLDVHNFFSMFEECSRRGC
ncbi:hypothetical protein EPI10_027546 [Gossypium australe]|uniref:Uncharacterized protein n=1 Tax=Gossypium australe TaxID=47621 RepID=A0A5B6UVB0_9ROSI|nr:hypothetical protein EPI10_027546 [Gossypium australe]